MLSYYSAHLYGLELGEYNFREEFDEIYTDYGEGDQYGILYMLINGNTSELPPAGLVNTKYMDLIGGYGCIDYVGYPAQMPYKEQVMSKEEMDQHLHDLAVYLYGEEKAKKIQPQEIDVAWSE